VNRRGLIPLAMVLLAGRSAMAQPTFTTVTGPVYTPISGVLFTGQLFISNQVMVGANASIISAWQYVINVQNGNIGTLALAPNSGATPTGTTYVFKYVPQRNSGNASTQYCTVPVSATPVALGSICVSTLPASPTVAVTLSQLTQSGATNGQCPVWSGSSWVPNSCSGGGGGSGTVTSVGLSLPGFFTVSGSPVTTSGTLTGTLATQSPNTVFAGPTTGGAAQPTFRALVAADMIGPLVSGCSDTQILFRAAGAVSCSASFTYDDSVKAIIMSQMAIVSPATNGQLYLQASGSGTGTAIRVLPGNAGNSTIMNFYNGSGGVGPNGANSGSLNNVGSLRFNLTGGTALIVASGVGTPAIPVTTINFGGDAVAGTGLVVNGWINAATKWIMDLNGFGVTATSAQQTLYADANNRIAGGSGSQFQPWVQGATSPAFGVPSATTTVTLGTIVDGDCANAGSITLTGAALGDVVFPGVSIALPAGVHPTAKVTATNTVTVEVCNLSESPQTIASATYKVGLLR